VLAILAILARIARVGTCAGRCENVEWNLIDEKNRQHDLSHNPEEPWFEHGLRPPSLKGGTEYAAR
jgi:hypothetical protein